MIYFGVVESRDDPLKLGRCRVRVAGLHIRSKSELPTEDLPWATPIQPITSAGMNGIGTTPLGPVEGSWVSIQYVDEFKQIPVMTGVIGGIPQPGFIALQKDPLIETEVVLTDSDNNPVVDGSGNPIGTGVKMPGAMLLSSAGVNFIQSEEKISSLVPGLNKFSTGSGLADTTLIYAYADSNGVWTIGWGSTYLEDNSRVDSLTVRTKGQCDALFSLKLKEYVAGVNRNLKVPVTQSMFDSLVSMSYNMGVGGLVNSEMFSSLNAGNYEAANALITKTKAKGLSNRRSAESSLFASEGYPNKDGSSVERSPYQVLEDEKKKTVPAAGTTTTNSAESGGFVDPNGKYPLFTGEPDTSRLARNESTNSTIVRMKEIARATGVETALGKTWDQPTIPYNARYPFNHVRTSESGHVQEFDDTRGSERIHTYHRSGTFSEIDVNGTQVNRIVGDSFEILERNGNVLIRGSLNVTVVGNSNFRVENDANIQVLGDLNTTVSGDYNLTVKGSINTKTGKDISTNANGMIATDAKNKIYLNSQKSKDKKLPTKTRSDMPVFQPLFVPTRKNVFDANYETPEEGNNSQFLERNASVIEPISTDPTTQQDSVPVPTKPQTQPVNTTCENLNDSDITTSYRLSPLFTLGDVIKGASASPFGVPQGVNFGLSASEIVCNLKRLTVNCLDVIKSEFPNMTITNTWRSEAVNTRIGGAKASDHLTGSAADIVLSGFSREQHFEAVQRIQELLPAFKQLILEYKGPKCWIHVSYRENQNKNECLTMDATKNVVIARGAFTLVS